MTPGAGIWQPNIKTQATGGRVSPGETVLVNNSAVLLGNGGETMSDAVVFQRVTFFVISRWCLNRQGDFIYIARGRPQRSLETGLCDSAESLV